MTNVLASHWSLTFCWAEPTLSQALVGFSCCPAREGAGGAHDRTRAADPSDQRDILLSFHKVSVYLFLQVSPFETVSSPYLVRRAIDCLKSEALLHSESMWGSLILHWATDTGKTPRPKDIKIWQFFWTASNRRDSNLLYTSQAKGMLSAIISHLGRNKQIYHITSYLLLYYREGFTKVQRASFRIMKNK